MTKHIVATKRNGDTHQSISDYKFRDDSSLVTEWKTKAEGVAYVRKNSGSTKCSGGGTEAQVFVNDHGSGPDFLQTIADGRWSDNLLALPVEK